MNTRRSRHPSPSEAFAAFRWLGWVMLMMFVLTQSAQTAGRGIKAQLEAIGPRTPGLSQTSAQFEPKTQQGSA